jgi:hypothetical protein
VKLISVVLILAVFYQLLKLGKDVWQLLLDLEAKGIYYSCNWSSIRVRFYTIWHDSRSIRAFEKNEHVPFFVMLMASNAVAANQHASKQLTATQFSGYMHKYRN